MNLFGARELALLNLADENLRIVRFAFGGLALFAAFVAFMHAAGSWTHRTARSAGRIGESSSRYSNVAAALASVPLIGGIIFFRARDSFVRFYAVQSLIFGCAWLLFNIVSAVVHGVFGAIPGIGGILVFFWAIIAALVDLAFLVMMMNAIVKAFTGVRWEIPYIGPIARKRVEASRLWAG
jgi:uncharacterized membrane protein